MAEKVLVETGAPEAVARLRGAAEEQREVEVTLRWGKLTPEQSRKVRKARQLLAEVGVVFDSDLNADGSICCWEMDRSLKGPVRVVLKRFVNA